MVSLITYLSSMPGDEFPTFDFPYLDKIVHFCLYFGLAFSLCRATTAHIRSEINWPLYRNRFVWGILFTFAFGLFDEWHQSFTPGREVEGLDLLADVLGGAVGAYCVLIYRQFLNRFFLARNQKSASV